MGNDNAQAQDLSLTGETPANGPDVAIKGRYATFQLASVLKAVIANA